MWLWAYVKKWSGWFWKMVEIVGSVILIITAVAVLYPQARTNVMVTIDMIPTIFVAVCILVIPVATIVGIPIFYWMVIRKGKFLESFIGKPDEINQLKAELKSLNMRLKELESLKDKGGVLGERFSNLLDNRMLRSSILRNGQIFF